MECVESSHSLHRIPEVRALNKKLLTLFFSSDLLSPFMNDGSILKSCMGAVTAFYPYEYVIRDHEKN